MSTQKQFHVLLNVEISETEKTYLIKADITGFHAQTVKVTPWQDSLIIEMETKHESGQSYYLGELESEYYRRIIPLGFDISDEHFYTKYNSGILKIYVLKPTTVKRVTPEILDTPDTARAVA